MGYWSLWELWLEPRPPNYPLKIPQMPTIKDHKALGGGGSWKGLLGFRVKGQHRSLNSCHLVLQVPGMHSMSIYIYMCTHIYTYILGSFKGLREGHYKGSFQGFCKGSKFPQIVGTLSWGSCNRNTTF